MANGTGIGNTTTSYGRCTISCTFEDHTNLLTYLADWLLWAYTVSGLVSYTYVPSAAITNEFAARETVPKQKPVVVVY